MAKEYMSVRAVAAAAGVSVQAVYKWIEKGELKAEVVEISEVEKRYRVGHEAASRFLRSRDHAPKKSAPRKIAAKAGSKPKGRAKGPMTGKDILDSGVVGFWADRDDIVDNLEFARELRKRASARGGNHQALAGRAKIASGRKSATPPAQKPPERKLRTGKELLDELKRNGLIGMWKDRDDIGDTLEFARKLRKQASTRHHD